MLEFRVKNIIPPGGKFFYAVDGKSGSIEFEGYTKAAIILEVQNYYRGNDEPIPDDIWLKIQDYMCRRVPEGFCVGDADGRPRAKVVTLQKVRQQAHDAVLAGRKQFVEHGTAENRAKICASCAENDRTMCPTCLGLVKWGERFVGNKKTSYNQYLGICTKDTLLLPVKVFLANLPQCNEEMPAHCWARRT